MSDGTEVKLPNDFDAEHCSGVLQGNGKTYRYVFTDLTGHQVIVEPQSDPTKSIELPCIVSVRNEIEWRDKQALRQFIEMKAEAEERDI